MLWTVHLFAFVMVITMRKQYIYFKDIPLYREFSLNGYRYIKKSSRTAYIIRPDEYVGVWRWFSKNNLCIEVQ